MCTLKNRGQRRGESSSILGPIITDLLIIFMKFNYSDTGRWSRCQGGGPSFVSISRHACQGCRWDNCGTGNKRRGGGVGERKGEGEQGGGEERRGEKRSEERREEVCNMSSWSFRFKADIPLVAESPGLDYMASFSTKCTRRSIETVLLLLPLSLDQLHKKYQQH